jgi:hypothetical protein
MIGGGLRAAALALAGALLRAAPAAGAFVPKEIAGGQCVPLPADGLCSSLIGDALVWQFTGTDLVSLNAQLTSETSFILKAAGGVATQGCKTNFLFEVCATW